MLSSRSAFAFWFFIRLLSALFPMLSIYLFSYTIQLLETHASWRDLALQIVIILLVYIVDNLTRLLSVYKLQYLISNTEFAIHRFTIESLQVENKTDRHASIQAIRNFGEAVRGTLELIRQPGVDSIVSLIVIPSILFFVDFRAFTLEIAYILIYFFTDSYTTNRYIHLKEIQDSRTESYYAALQDTNDIDLESTTFSRHYHRLCNWGFVEWFSLQNIAVTFYSLILFLQIYLVYTGEKNLSGLLLVMGYISQTQVFLNNFSTIKDRLADTQVALTRLAKNDTISAIDLDDLV